MLGISLCEGSCIREGTKKRHSFLLPLDNLLFLIEPNIEACIHVNLINEFLGRRVPHREVEESVRAAVFNVWHLVDDLGVRLVLALMHWSMFCVALRKAG